MQPVNANFNLPEINHDQTKTLGTMRIGYETWRVFLYTVDEKGQQTELKESFESSLEKTIDLAKILVDAHIRHYPVDLSNINYIEMSEKGLSIDGRASSSHDFALNEQENEFFKRIINNQSQTTFKAQDIWLEIFQKRAAAREEAAHELNVRLQPQRAIPIAEEEPLTPPQEEPPITNNVREEPPITNNVREERTLTPEEFERKYGRPMTIFFS